MSFKHKDERKLKISPKLFETKDGEPMCFYLRPGPVKRELMPFINAAGGLLCNVQKPGAILLLNPEEKTSIKETTAHWYVSTKYIHDCVERNKKLNIEDYRLNPETITKRRHSSKVGSPNISSGRTAYSPEEDDAILSYVSKHIGELGGNKFWQEMAKQQVTCHSWQSMKYRYRVQLAHRLSEYKHANVGKENNMQDTEQGEDENEKRASPQRTPVDTEDPDNSSPEMDLTQNSQSSASQDEQAKCNNGKECDIIETPKSEIDETPEQEEPAQDQPNEASSEEENQSEAISEAKSVVNSVNRPVTRQQFELENAPYVKRLRSSGTALESPVKSTNKQINKTKAYSSPKSDSREAQAPPKKMRKMEDKVAETIETENNEDSAPTEIRLTDQVNCNAPQPTKKKLGILEMATKEFEDDSESESDSQYETPGPSTSIEAVIATSSNPDPNTLLSENQEGASDRAPDENRQPVPANANTADSSTSPPTSPPSTSHPAVPEPTTGGSVPMEEVTSKAHLFIFESESQEVEEDSQSVLAGPSTAATGQSHENINKITPSLTQDQLEEDVQFLKMFMQETNQDLISVTKSILKASGDLVLARELLVDPSSFSGPTWTRTEDQNLCSTDPIVRQELLNKYGEDGVAKRLMFLELER